MLMYLFYALFLLLPLIMLTIWFLVASLLAITRSIKVVISCVLVVIAVISFSLPFVASNMLNTATSDPTISIIEVEEIFKDIDDDSNVTYYVREKDSSNLTSVTGDVFKGDSNYIIKYEYPNMTDRRAWLLYDKKIEYSIIVTNPDNIKEITDLK